MTVKTQSSGVTLLIGAAVFLSVAFCVLDLGWFAGLFIERTLLHRAEHEVPMTAELVTARALPAGKVLSYHDLNQREIPTAIVSRDDVKPSAAAYILGSVLKLPLEAGEPIRYSLVEAPNEHDLDTVAAIAACSAASHGSGPPTVAELRQLALKGPP